MLRAMQARYVFPVAAPPIADGVVVIDGERIVEVAAADRVWARVPTEDLGNVAILPGLVNAHTHLEFSDLDKPLGKRGMSFPAWIRAVIAHRQQQSPNVAIGRKREAIARGLHESLASGTTTLGEIATAPLAAEPFRQTLMRGVIYLESLGFSDERIAEAMQRSVDFIAGPPVAKHWASGLSPHAPYSTPWQLVAALCGRWPVAMHLAESREELELLETHAGPFRQLLDDLGIWRDDAFPRSPGVFWYLQQLARSPHALVVHGNYLSDEEIAFVAQHGQSMSVVYCPRTHAYFQHEPYPLAKLLAAGVNVALGTDSRASNPDLSLLAEMRHVAQHQPIAPDVVLRLGTIHGALSLGMFAEVGSIESGKRADLAVVALPDGDARDPHDLLFATNLPCRATYWGGVPIVL